MSWQQDNFERHAGSGATPRVSSVDSIRRQARADQINTHTQSLQASQRCSRKGAARLKRRGVGVLWVREANSAGRLGSAFNMQRDRGMSIASAFEGEGDESGRLEGSRPPRRPRTPSDMDMMAMIGSAAPSARKTKPSTGARRVQGRPPRAARKGPASSQPDAQSRLEHLSLEIPGRSRGNSMDLSHAAFARAGVSGSAAQNTLQGDAEQERLGLVPPSNPQRLGLGDIAGLGGTGLGSLAPPAMGDPVALAARSAPVALASPSGEGQPLTFPAPSHTPASLTTAEPSLRRCSSAPPAVDSVAARFLAPASRARAESVGEGGGEALGSALLELSQTQGHTLHASPESKGGSTSSGGGGSSGVRGGDAGPPSAHPPRRRVGSAVSLSSEGTSVGRLRAGTLDSTTAARPAVGTPRGLGDVTAPPPAATLAAGLAASVAARSAEQPTEGDGGSAADPPAPHAAPGPGSGGRERASSTGSLAELMLLLPLGDADSLLDHGSTGPPTHNTVGSWDSGSAHLHQLLEAMAAHIADTGGPALDEEEDSDSGEGDDEALLVEDDDDVADLALLGGEGGLLVEDDDDESEPGGDMVVAFTAHPRQPPHTGSAQARHGAGSPGGHGGHALPSLAAPGSAPPKARGGRHRSFSLASVDSALGPQTPLMGQLTAGAGPSGEGVSGAAPGAAGWGAAAAAATTTPAPRSSYGAEIMAPLAVPLTASAGLPLAGQRQGASAKASAPAPTPSRKRSGGGGGGSSSHRTPTPAQRRAGGSSAGGAREAWGASPGRLAPRSPGRARTGGGGGGPAHFTIDGRFRVGLRRVPGGYRPTFATLPAIAVGILTSVTGGMLRDPRSMYEIPPDRATRISVQQLQRQLHTAHYGGSSARSRAIVWRGAYTLVQRVARVANWYYARRRRVWDRVKQIKYDHRQKLANNRLRVKGRFVKAADILQDPELLAAAVRQQVDMDAMTREAVGQLGREEVPLALARLRSSVPQTSPLHSLVCTGTAAISAALAAGVGDDVASSAASPLPRGGRKRGRGSSVDSASSGGGSVEEVPDPVPATALRQSLAAAMQSAAKRARQEAGGGVRLSLQPPSAQGSEAASAVPATRRTSRRAARSSGDGDTTPRTAGLKEAMRRAVAKAVKNATTHARAELGLTRRPPAPSA